MDWCWCRLNRHQCQWILYDIYCLMLLKLPGTHRLGECSESHPRWVPLRRYLDLAAAGVSVREISVTSDMMKTCRSPWIHSLIIVALFVLGSARPAWAADQILSGSIKEM